VVAIRRAVILAAGLGTRMLPATKAVPKELLPIVDKPLIQYAVEEAVAAGVEHVVIVVAEGKEAITDHFGHLTRIEAWARESGNAALLRSVQEPSALARFDFVLQDAPRGIAHAVACAREYVEGEPFALIFPDDLILADRPCLGQLSEVYSGDGSLLAVQEVAVNDISQYGIVDPVGAGNPVRLRGLVEKPAPAAAPSNLGVVGRYILGATIFEHIDGLTAGTNGELQITDALVRQLSAGEPVLAYRYSGRRFDTGRPLGYLLAGIAVGLHRPGLGDELRARLTNLLHEGVA
jgi:UTP--glucose-1-phosphate uridylyltransferase